MKGNTLEIASLLTAVLAIIVFLIMIEHQRREIEYKIVELKYEVDFLIIMRRILLRVHFGNLCFAPKPTVLKHSDQHSSYQQLIFGTDVRMQNVFHRYKTLVPLASASRFTRAVSMQRSSVGIERPSQ